MYINVLLWHSYCTYYFMASNYGTVSLWNVQHDVLFIYFVIVRVFICLFVQRAPCCSSSFPPLEEGDVAPDPGSLPPELSREFRLPSCRGRSADHSLQCGNQQPVPINLARHGIHRRCNTGERHALIPINTYYYRGVFAPCEGRFRDSSRWPV